MRRHRSLEGLSAILAFERLHEDDVGMALRSTFDRVFSFVAKTPVESGGLKAVRCEDDLRATATDGLSFGCVEECLSQATASMLLTDPEMRDLGAASPSMATETCDDSASFIPNACPHKPSIKVARRVGVELVDALHEKRIELPALIVVEQNNSFGLHGT
jgi:hypothetical protein